MGILKILTGRFDLLPFYLKHQHHLAIFGRKAVEHKPEDCIFCKIIKGESPAEFIYQDDDLVVFKDIRPLAPVHLLIVPKKHIRSINNLEPDDHDIVAKMIFVGKDLAKKMDTDQKGYNLLFNVEWGGGQRVFHIHLHLLGGRS